MWFLQAFFSVDGTPNQCVWFGVFLFRRARPIMSRRCPTYWKFCPLVVPYGILINYTYKFSRQWWGITSYPVRKSFQEKYKWKETAIRKWSGRKRPQHIWELAKAHSGDGWLREKFHRVLNLGLGVQCGDLKFWTHLLSNMKKSLYKLGMSILLWKLLEYK